MDFLYWLKNACSLIDLAAAKALISVYAAPATDGDLDNKQCNKCRSAKGTRSPFDALIQINREINHVSLVSSTGKSKKNLKNEICADTSIQGWMQNNFSNTKILLNWNI